MTRKGFYDCDICGFASTDETMFRGIVMDEEKPGKRMITDAFANDRHVCIECMKVLAEHSTKFGVPPQP